MATRTIPAAPDQITADWLTVVLAAALGRVAVRSVRSETIGRERGFTGIVARLHLEYAEALAGAPSTIIAKCPLAQTVSPAESAEQDRADPIAVDRALRELRFYRDHILSGAVPTPRLFFGDADERLGTAVLLMQDLGAMAAGDVLVGATPAEADAVLTAIAPLHARFWGSAAVPRWLPQADVDRARLEQRLAQHVGPFLSKFRRDLPVPVGELIERLPQRYGAVLAALARLPRTVIHGDLHLDNVLFATDTRSAPVVILDWQSVAVGPAMRDLAIFIGSGVSVAGHRSAVDALLATYHRRLGQRGNHGYTLAHVRDHFRLALLRHLAGVVTWLGGVDWSQLSGRERAVTEAAVGDGRLVAALTESDIAALV